MKENHDIMMKKTKDIMKKKIIIDPMIMKETQDIMIMKEIQDILINKDAMIIKDSHKSSLNMNRKIIKNI